MDVLPVTTDPGVAFLSYACLCGHLPSFHSDRSPYGCRACVCGSFVLRRYLGLFCPATVCGVCGHPGLNHANSPISNGCFYKDPPVGGVSIGCVCSSYIPISIADVDVDLTLELS